MYKEFHKAAIVGCRVLIKPVVRLFLSYGLSFNEFVELAKHAYIRVATEGQPDAMNISLTAAKTGISRKSIRKLIDSKEEVPVSLTSDGLYDLRVLELWRENSRYQDKHGKPVPLYFTGDHTVTLSGLIDELEVDLPTSTILKRMLSMDMIDIDNEGRYFPRFEDPTPGVVQPEYLVRASLFAAAHVDTVVKNFTTDTPEKMLERQVFSVKVPKERHGYALNDIRKICNTAFSEIETALSGYELSGETDSREMIGVGVYAIDLELPVDKLSGVFDGIGGK